LSAYLSALSAHCCSNTSLLCSLVAKALSTICCRCDRLRLRKSTTSDLPSLPCFWSCVASWSELSLLTWLLPFCDAGVTSKRFCIMCTETLHHVRRASLVPRDNKRREMVCELLRYANDNARMPVRLKCTWSRLTQAEKVHCVLANVESAVHEWGAVNVITMPHAWVLLALVKVYHIRAACLI